MQVILTVLLLYKGVKHTKKERVTVRLPALSFPKKQNVCFVQDYDNISNLQFQQLFSRFI